MEYVLEPFIAFGALLRDDPEASRFYDACTPAQRQAIIRQLPLQTPETMPAFVSHLPSAVF